MPLTIKDSLTINDVDKDGDVQITMENSYGDELFVYIDQNQIAQVVAFLQDQLKP